jgi:mannose-1-phosphate guanylyltransferase
MTLKDVKAIIPAGGAGTRFHPYTEIIPKPMIPVGEHEKPVLEMIVKWIKRFGIHEFVFLVGYKWKYIYNYFGNGARFGVKIDYSIDDHNGYRGIGGAILKAYRFGLISKRALIWYGDILAPVDIHDLLNFHRDVNADLTLVISRRYRVPVGVVKVNDKLVVEEIREKPELDIMATLGIGVLESSVLEEPIEDDLGKNFDFMGDFVPWMIKRGYKVFAYIYEGAWYDVGSLERYKKLSNNDLAIFNEVL